MNLIRADAEYWNHTSPCWACGDNYTAVDLHYANRTHFVGLLGFVDYYSTELFAAAAVTAIHRHATLSIPPSPAATATARSSSSATAASADASTDAAAAAAKPRLFAYIAFEAAHGASSCYVEGAPPDCDHPDDDELQVGRWPLMIADSPC